MYLDFQLYSIEICFMVNTHILKTYLKSEMCICRCSLKEIIIYRVQILFRLGTYFIYILLQLSTMISKNRLNVHSILEQET